MSRASKPPSLPLRQHLRCWIIPSFLAFAASFCIMTLELVAGRLVAQYLGSSLYTWTAVIGVVLAGITAGNFAGGWLADFPRPRHLLSVAFLVAAAGAFATPFLNRWIGGWDWYAPEARFFQGGWLVLLGPWQSLAEVSWPARIFLHTAWVFLLPSVLLGLIGPIVAKMALDLGHAPGKTIGTVYAAGALGSIAGTFFTGYYLIAHYGTITVILGVALALAILGTLVRSPAFWPGALALLVLFAATTSGEFPSYQALLSRLSNLKENVVFAKDSQYSFMTVEEDPSTGVRALTLNRLIHAYVDPADPLTLLYDYENTYKAVLFATVDRSEGLSALFLGGGGFTFPRFVHALFPDAHLQVAEIDPEVTRAAFAELALEPTETHVVKSVDEIADDPIIWIRNADARNHVEDLLQRKLAGEDIRLDYIVGDAFDDYAIPFHLATKEFYAKLAELLDPESGIYLATVIDAPGGAFLSSIVKTLDETFPSVQVFWNDGGESDSEESDTFVVVASLQPADLSALPDSDPSFALNGTALGAEQMAALRANPGALVFTDDYAPVEQMLASVIRFRRW